MTDLPTAALHVAQSIQPLGNAPVRVAFSGGADSLALLIATCQALPAAQVSAVHVNHAVNESADTWQSHCESVCRALDVALVVLQIDREQLPNAASETVLHDARYRLFEALLQPGEVLLTAHHLDDVAETTLLAMMRGGTPKELAGIPYQRPLGKGLVLRPFLAWRSADLQKIVSDAGLVWIEDPSNTDLRHPRSVIRHQVMPALQTVWNDPAQLLATTAQRQRDGALALDEAIDALLPATQPRKLPLAALTERSVPLAIAILRRFLDRNQVAQPTRVALAELVRQMACPQRRGSATLEQDQYQLRTYRNDLFLVCSAPQPDPDLLIHWQGLRQELPSGQGWLAWQAQGNSSCAGPWPRLEVRYGIPGGRIKCAGSAHHKTLKKLFQERGVPPWERLHTPLVRLGEEILMAGNLGKSQTMRSLEAQLKATAVWQRLDQGAPLG